MERALTRASVLAIPCLALACAGRVESSAEAEVTGSSEADSAHTAPDAADAGELRDAGDATDRDADDVATSPPCAPISGTAPFGVRLAGSGPVTDADIGGEAGGTVSAVIDVYFPNGRIAGGDVVIAYANTGGGASVSHGKLDATLSARGLRAGDRYCGNSVQGELLGPADGLLGIASNNTSGPSSDLLSMVHGPVKLCAVGAVPEQKLPTTWSSEILPFDPLNIRGSRPFARDSFASITGSVPLDVFEGDPGVLIRPKTAMFSLFAPTTVELAGLRDVLGAPLGLSTVRTKVPTDVVTDLTFATLPAPGAYVGGPLSVDSGVLSVGPNGVAALSLGARSSATRLRLRHRVQCASFCGTAAWSVSVVTPIAASTELRPSCESTLREDTIVLPAGGPYMLLAKHDRYVSLPCNYPAPCSKATYELDQLTFE